MWKKTTVTDMLNKRKRNKKQRQILDLDLHLRLYSDILNFQS